MIGLEQAGLDTCGRTAGPVVRSVRRSWWHRRHSSDAIADLGVTLADASLVVLAERHNAQDVLTLDERDFRVLSANRRPFRLLPADG